MVKHNTWALQDAKNGFSRVVENALKNGPQLVTKHGKEAVVVISATEFRKAETRKSGNLVTFFQSSPLQEAGLDFERTEGHARDIEL